MTSIQKTATIGKVLALGLLVAALLAMLLSMAAAGAATTSGKAFAWGYNEFGNLGNGASGAAADTDVPVAVKNLTGVRNIDGGFVHTLAVAQ